MKIYWKCGCGSYNYNREDWISHFKYRGFWNGLKNLLKTRPHVQR